MQGGTSGQGQDSNATPGLVTVETIKNKCLDSQGYVLFVGIIRPERDPQGNNLIDFHYIRQNYSFEDTRKAVDEFKKALVNDVSAA